ncbi:MAG: efflux RND transporter permease subunit [Myxococcota bacterium]|jgi:hydrophobe/amphiphile efflux-1 (HAE1) family protein|nr:efflux RND transporter permease subunit [Myxococcota bacterium]
MRLSEICVERPVFASVLSLLITLLGVIALFRLPNRELPDVDPPIVSVTTVYTGAAPDVVETSVTEPLEDQLIGIEGIKHITSISREQVSSISLEFDLARNVDLAAADVRDRVARARNALPSDIEEPVVAKQDADASPVLWLALSGGQDPIAVSRLAEDVVKDRLAKLPGVASVVIAGERRLSMRVWIDNDRLTSYLLTVDDVSAALRRENVDLPSGRIEGAGREFTVRTLGELDTARAFEELVVANVKGQPVRLRDVGRVEVGAESERKIVRFNGEAAVGLGIVKLSKANTIAVADAVVAELDQIRSELPSDVKLTVAFDGSSFIRDSISNVLHSLAEAIVLVLIVIYLFLRTFRATLVPAVAIPVSILGTFTILYFAGFTINTLTLMGLTLAIGLVVDDAIIVLENVTRWIENGMTPREAAIHGMREIAFAVVASTVSVVAVFLPLAYLSDTTGRLFGEFGVTVAASVAISGLVALTLSPALCARVLRARTEQETGVRASLARASDRLTDGYTSLLRRAMAHRGLSVGIGLAWFALGLAMLAGGAVDREFIPSADRGGFFVFTRAPDGATIEYTDRYHSQVEALVAETPEVVRNFSVIALGLGAPGNVNEGIVIGSLEPERDRHIRDVIQELRPKLAEVAGVQAYANEFQALGRGFGGAPVSVVLMGPDIEALSRYADELAHRAEEEIPGLFNVRSDLHLNKPQIDVEIDRDRASDLGVSVREISSTLQILLGGVDLSTFKLNGQTYDVIVQLERRERSLPTDIPLLYVHGTDGQLVPLSSMVTLQENTAASGVPHFDRQRAATVTASLAPGISQGEALEKVRALAEEILPDDGGHRVGFSGESEQFFESGQAIVFAYLLGIVVIYLVLAAQFESFVHPLTILIAVALSFTGALATLWITGTTLNLFSQIGMVMLVGLVAKNSILIVEFANQLREEGKGIAEAAFEAGRTRFRPILMTALSTIVGMLPIALGGSREIGALLGVGAGGELRAPLGIAAVGGMAFSTALTVFVVPAAYVLIETLRTRGREPRSVATPTPATPAA